MPYNPEHDRITDTETLIAFVRTHPLAQLVTHDGSRPDVDFIPMLIEALHDEAASGEGKSLRLVGHVARNNPLWQRPQSGPVVATFCGEDHYISPSFYPGKAEHHRAVPTWNYLVAHAWGELIVHDETKWVRRVVAQLTTAMEAGRAEPWRMGMAPSDYLDDMLAKIVGIEVRISHIEGRFKVGAQRPAADRQGGAAGVRAEGATELADAMSPPDPIR